ncbi:MAG: hypothetical protein ACM3O4_04825 [Ignavibacteriales bacterium]
MKYETGIKIIKYVFFILFICFIIVYCTSMAGYYDYQQRQRVVLTEEKIKEFEEDIKNGRSIDIDKYVEEQNKFDHVSKRLGSKLSEVISKYTRKGIENTFRMLNNFVES